MSKPSQKYLTTIYQRPVELLQNLIRFDTTNPPGNEAECITYVNNLLTEARCETTLLARDPKRPNLIARIPGQGSAPALLMHGHVDVVTTKNQTWQHPPFEGKLSDGCVWGRGALDMKSCVAMMLSAFMRIKAEGITPPGDVVLAVLSDEEAGSDYGARYLVENHAKLFEGIRYAIGEFGGFTFHLGQKRFYPIMVAEKQSCWIRVILRGPSGHGSQPLRGGAMAKLGEVLQKLDRQHFPVHITPATRWMIEKMAESQPLPLSLVWRQLLNPKLTDRILKLLGSKGKALAPLLHNTVSPIMVRGGEKINVIPSEIVLDLDGRILPGYDPDDMLAELRRIIGKKVELEIMRYDPFPNEPNMGLFDTLADILKESDPEGIPMPLLLSATTDARFFSWLGIQTYGFTPMKLPPGFDFWKYVHAADEHIPVEAVSFGAEAVYKLLQLFGDKK